MPTDIKLDDVDGNWLVLEGAIVKTTASDLMIDSPGRRSSSTGFGERSFTILETG